MENLNVNAVRDLLVGVPGSSVVILVKRSKPTSKQTSHSGADGVNTIVCVELIRNPAT